MPLKKYARSVKEQLTLPPLAKAMHHRDVTEGLGDDPGIEATVKATVQWLRYAQEFSKTHDGGLARHFSLVSGWGSSYPETTGYAIPTILDVAARWQNDDLRERARRMLDWLVRIQFPQGGFQGGTVDREPAVPVTFNTGQILIGLAAGYRVFGEPYAEPMHRAAQWLVDTQDADGCWRKHPTPFADPGEKAYETHVSWGLFEAAHASGEQAYAEAGLRNVAWALTKQQQNGWFADNCLDDAEKPLTHTIGYVLRGVLEAYRYSGEKHLLAAAQRTAEGVRTALRPNGYLPGRLNKHWQEAAMSACLTGSVQIAHCWLTLYRETGDDRFREAAFAANRYVRRTVRLDDPADTRGGIKGSFPVSGDYLRYEYPNWAAKFFIDAQLFEQDTRQHDATL